MERVNVLEELVDMYFEKYPKHTKSTLLVFLKENEHRIAGNYDRECHREDIIYELADCDYETDRIPDDLIDNMVDDFEDKLGDYGCECGWRDILCNVIDDYEEDLKEYSYRQND